MYGGQHKQGFEGVAAQFEEIVIETDFCFALFTGEQYAGPDSGQGFPGFIDGRVISPGVAGTWFWQAFPVDFDSSGCGWRALDIGVYLASDKWMDISDEAEVIRQRKLGMFLEGYTRHRSLYDNELAAIQLTPLVRHIFLMGHVLRYTAVVEGNHWADDGFIDWHMTWFKHWASRTNKQ